ncbi:hypothetical protein VQ02_33885 [Methylobacterium variabile]|jgi:diacylglycerol kinase (ATP)|uniref:Diacylglycerol kinase n=1 Tax=Methylobacterium variabile TaxID=298794 RepID=A0A0J6RVR4_9HYPH|nr:diacylglycerol kinase [Methylobacterium variabile]KMO26980.1 hypothetical protein VQ02_33885 [Methylobacterium variabile]
MFLTHPFLTQSRSALRHSLQGLAVAARSERAVRQELAVLAVALPVAFLIAGSIHSWIALIGSLVLVLVAELLNTAVEKLCDHLHPGRHPAIGTVKDLGSAAVFCALVFAAIVWISLAGLAVVEWRAVP